MQHHDGVWIFRDVLKSIADQYTLPLSRKTGFYLRDIYPPSPPRLH